jgi:DNA-binding transcriptional regulator YiaG
MSAKVVEHDCRDYINSKRATAAKPFLFTASGLSNVYLSGIHYNECARCASVAGIFPAVSKLLDTLTRTIIVKTSPLTGSEIKYLRTYVQKKAVDFAQLVGVSSEQVSRWENGHNPPEKSADKLMRLLVANKIDLEPDGIVNLVTHPIQKESYLLRFREDHWSGVCQELADS